MNQLFHYRWRPFTIRDNRCIRADDAEWASVRELNQLAAEGGWQSNGCKRPRILIDADLGVQWEGPVCDKSLRQWFHSWVVGEVTTDEPPARLVGLEQRRAVTFPDIIRDVFRLIDDCPNCDFMLKTEWPEMCVSTWLPNKNIPPPNNRLRYRRENLWLATAIHNQATADERIPQLLKCRDLCSKTVVWWEAMEHQDLGYWLGRVDYDPNDIDCGPPEMYEHGADWLIIEGNTQGPTDIAIVRAGIEQARAAGVPVWVESIGGQCCESGSSSRFYEWPEGNRHVVANGKTAFHLKHPQGADPSEWPVDLRLRQLPGEG